LKLQYGAEAIFTIFKKIDLQKLLTQLKTDLEKASSLESVKVNKRIAIVSAMINSNIRPEWMFLTSYSSYSTSTKTNGSSRWRTICDF
jgi:DNA-directed RNA polymerase beta' subunit